MAKKYTAEERATADRLDINIDALSFFVSSRKKSQNHNDHRNRRKVQQMCKVLGVTESGYYKSIRNREQPSKCELRWSEVLNNIYELLREDAVLFLTFSK